MNYFEYPLDTKMLYRKKAKIKRELLQQKNLLTIRVAVLGGSTTNELVDQLCNFLLHFGIRAEFYQSEYGQYWQDAVFGNRELDCFRPDIIYIHTSWRNIESFPDIGDTRECVDQKLENEIKRFTMMWEALEGKFHCPIIQNNFDRPNYRLMGNRDIFDYRGRSNYISRMNQALYIYAQQHEHFYINDLDYLAQMYGLREWSDPLYWHMYKCAMCLNAIPYVAQSIANIIKSLYGKNKKVLVLDLDNTLWGGVVGDDGVDGIQIGPEVPRGQVYTEFQSYCKKLQEIGVILAVDSKNDMENAMAGLNHPAGVLRPDDFVAIKANWNPKDQNLREIAEELSLGTDSFVFADDNPAEREIVACQMPEVAVPALKGVENYIWLMDHGGYFETTVLSAEDQNKTKLYHAKAAAGRAAAAFTDYGEYLDSLEMTAVIGNFQEIDIQRIAQLTNKSNQFNLTTMRCSEEDIYKMQADGHHICLSGRLKDKFGDNGIVTVVSGEREQDCLHIRLWLMSCRVLKRGMEDSMMNVLAAQAQKCGIKTLIGYYYPTAKNGMVREFYAGMGFEKIAEDTDGNSTWKLALNSYQEKKLRMLVEQRDI